MRTLAAVGILILFALAVWAANPACGPAEGKSPAPTASVARPAIVVELFTSEGCSSCPPADKVLAWLGNNQPLAGVEIIPLSEHVDYWNHLGWADPYSSSDFTGRQQAYSSSLHSGTYTPQMVVDGKVEFVGSDSNAALQAIRNESRAPQTAVQIQPVELNPSPGQKRIAFSVEVGQIPIRDGKKSFVFLAITENNLRSSVAAGENSGRTLAHTAVVRELKLIGKLETRPEATFRAQPQVELSPNWNREDLRAIVFVQLQDNRRILGAAETAIPSH